MRGAYGPACADFRWQTTAMVVHRSRDGSIVVKTHVLASTS
jgi:hypothetical protein